MSALRFEPGSLKESALPTELLKLTWAWSYQQKYPEKFPKHQLDNSSDLSDKIVRFKIF
jgi:hypothetical protein